MSDKSVAPDEAVRLAYVGKRYFLDSQSRLQIASEMKVSRFTVARLIQKALDTGVVKITISAPGRLDALLSVELAARFGLANAYVISTATDNSAELRAALGAMAAELIASVVVEGDIVGLSAGRTVIEMSRALGEIAYCDVVQLTGVADPVQERGTEAVTTMSQRSGGAVYPLSAPFLVTDAAAAAAIVRQPTVKQSLARLDNLTRAVVTIGAWPGDSLLRESLVPSGEAADLVAAGIVAEIGTTLLDAHGRPIDVLAPRMIGISTSQLRAVPQVIAVAGGSQKHAAIAAVLKSGMISDLVTDENTARYLLGAG